MVILEKVVNINICTPRVFADYLDAYKEMEKQFLSYTGVLQTDSIEFDEDHYINEFFAHSVKRIKINESIHEEIN